MQSNLIQFGKCMIVGLMAQECVIARKADVAELMLVEVGKRPQRLPTISPLLE